MTPLPSGVLEHIVDSHCHPTDAPSISAASMQQLQITVCAMSTHSKDQSLVRELAQTYPSKIIPCFGHHPWFSHFITTNAGVAKHEHYHRLFQPTEELYPAFEDLLPHLPEPVLLDDILVDLRSNFASCSSPPMLGEVGIDAIFKVPYDYHATPRRISPFMIPLEHQLTVLEAQIDIAVEFGASVSFHSVKCPQATLELFDRLKRKHEENWNNIRFDIHSCSMSPETLVQLQRKHANVWMSVSTTINGRSRNLRPLIAACAVDKLLIESDYDAIEQSTPKCLEILDIVAEVKGWHIETDWDDGDENGAVHRLEANWKVFSATQTRTTE
ncbi:TatD DNase family Scn1 [Mycena indigotica]|uniref:TatD DNase family Scn1 n=1 Tax=Mycena indigotica TaxID=2126181 RepID=A0A8H6SWH4_9AGAR|nr:TatD DNase family Scn1 [Mycena indigotica]KAF7307213.1 TatD DNase family Scn1 [Mycena indigotica]